MTVDTKTGALEQLRAELRAVAPAGRSVVTIGKFDGVHLGHTALVRTAVDRANHLNAKAGVITFDPLPYAVFNPGKPFRYLCTVPERVQRLKDAGADFVAPITFTAEISQLSAEEFVRALSDEVGLVELVVGPDAAIGRGREGSVDRLRALGQDLDYSLVEVPPFQLDGRIVNSSLVRHLLWDGFVEEAARALGRRFAASGPVIAGDQRGRELGFPTANLLPPEHVVTPADGVYGCLATVNGSTYRAAVSIGVRPTFGEGLHRLIEAYLLDFSGDLYGHELRLEYVFRVRGEERFDSVDALIAGMNRDVALIRLRVALP